MPTHADSTQPPARSRRDRIRRIRRMVAAWTATAFVAVFGVVYVQMNAGNDPALGAGTTAAVASTGTDTSTSDTDTSTSDADADTSSSDTSSSDTSSSSTSSAPSAVTTQQS